MNDLRRAWGPSAITRWSVIGGALAVVVLALAGGQSIPGFPPLDRVVTALGAVAAAAAWLGLARITWLHPTREYHRPGLAMSTFAAAGAVAGASRAGLIAAMGADDPLSVAWRVVATAIAAVIWLALTAIVVDHVRSHRAAMAALRLKQAELEDLRRQEHEELDALATRLRDDLLSPVHATLARIRAALAIVGAGGPAAHEAVRIENVVATSIRPLSHEILAADPAPAPTAVVGETTRRERTAVLMARASRQVVRAPWVVTLVPVMLVPLMLGPSWGITFLLVNAVVTWPIYSALLMGLRRLLEPRLRIMSSTPAAAAALLTGYAVTTAVVVGITTGLGGLSPRPVPYMWIGIVTLTAILTAATVLQAASDLAAEDEHTLREVLSGIALSLARIQQRLRHEHQVLGALLHGPVQGALLAVAGSLERVGAHTPADERRVIVDEAARQLAEIERRLAAPADDGQSLDDAISGVLMLWTRVLDVQILVADDARAALNASPGARGAVADVLAEALTNAFRHGRARTAWVTIALDARGAQVRVIDDGQMAAAAAPGMGSRLYDECAQEWSLRPLDDGRTVVHLVVPVVASGGLRRGESGAAATR